jgi:monoamine oxidase
MAPFNKFAQEKKIEFEQQAPPAPGNSSAKDLNESFKIKARLAAAMKYDQHTLQSYFETVAGWSPDCVRLYDYCSAHVVLGNAVGESAADAFLSVEEQNTGQSMRQLKGGLDRFAWAFLNQKSNYLADKIRFGARVRQVTYRRRGADSIEVHYESAGKMRTEMADYVIFAVPFPAMKTIRVEPRFDFQKTQAISELRYVEVTKILAQFKSRWWEDHLNGMQLGSEGGLVTDLPIRYLVFPHSKSSQFTDVTPNGLAQQRGVVMASYTFERDAAGLGTLSESDKLQVVRDNLSEIFGNKLIEDSLEFSISQNWSNDSLAGGAAFAYFGPHQLTRLYKPMVLPDWDGRAHFAGEHASALHGWIEGALASAQRVALDISLHSLS